MCCKLYGISFPEALEMQAAGYFETSVNICQDTGCQIPESLNIKEVDSVEKFVNIWKIYMTSNVETIFYLYITVL
jgi:hypothetical protein